MEGMKDFIDQSQSISKPNNKAKKKFHVSKITTSALRNAGKNQKDVVYSSLEMIAGKKIGQKVKLNCKQLQK